MKVYVMLPFIKLRFNNEFTEYVAALTEDYAEQFDDMTYTYPVDAEQMGKKAHCAGSISWVYTQILPQTFRIYTGR